MRTMNETPWGHGGTVTYEHALGIVWDYREWQGWRFGGRRWAAAVRANGAVVDRAEGFRTRVAALAWLEAHA